ncbi:hypothetical protein E5720_09780 [Rhodococcus sp. PAMC28707]|uniref:DUF6474 family protein n=1 Tax=unclassified Rhodococcus (in: high G+C Gram-positive bacteria) TaxID=192944 RepID=UPI00109D97EB|nr:MULTISPECIES: DUF6474 family protein [unclassified Rhodococcus (in: high G+C Gram-positive bacteria)]QCB49547.1 hypothetical protein E5769_04235 [Rhodococcus sp. PAMC28705]QCB58763.1 hypothetical protein E5720_09780 [Rhodococcus sp. PAMC28707]
MGLFRKRKGRATRRAEAKALKHKATLEAKFGAKNERKQLKSIAKAQGKLSAVEAKSSKNVEKAQVAALKAQQKAAMQGKFSAAQVRKYIGIARVLIPVLTPIVYRGAALVRGKLDERKASQLGINPAELGQYTGYGAKLSARIAGAEKSLERVTSGSSDAETTKFADAISQRLTDLGTAVRTSEQMPAPRRKAAHNAISAELDGIEADLLARLGVR